jgi:hypothetical protein
VDAINAGSCRQGFADSPRVELRKDAVAARPVSAVQYAPDARLFSLWGFMNADYDLLQKRVTMPVPEHDMVVFDSAQGRWQSHLPQAWAAAWRKQLPPVFIPLTYAGIHRQRTLPLSPVAGISAQAAHPDLNIVFDQVAYHPPTK